MKNAKIATAIAVVFLSMTCMPLNADAASWKQLTDWFTGKGKNKQSTDTTSTTTDTTTDTTSTTTDTTTGTTTDTSSTTTDTTAGTTTDTSSSTTDTTAGTTTDTSSATTDTTADTSVGVTRSSVNQFGITWTFDKGYPTGQFANGDYWVIGPVTIVGISPGVTINGDRTMNGSMINPVGGSRQGYDSYRDYDASLNDGIGVSASSPLILQPGSSLVSTISSTEFPDTHSPYLYTAAVLTVLDADPGQGAFRPPYAGSSKPIYYQSDLNTGLLKSLPPVANTPNLGTMERHFERPWIDHLNDYYGRYHHPLVNMETYGREISAIVGQGALMLHLDFPLSEKMTLLTRYVQLGIDLYGIATNGGKWPPNGGHASGRKWPIVFAGLMLGDAGMTGIKDATLFGEDAQTFFVTENDVAMTHRAVAGLVEYGATDVGMPEWGIRHATDPSRDNKNWDASYRRCCTANAWVGFVLAARMMVAQIYWDHDALFEYQDRFMNKEATYGETWQLSIDPFALSMWKQYRSAF